MENVTSLFGFAFIILVALGIIAKLGVFDRKTQDDNIAHVTRQRVAVDETQFQSRALFNASELKIFGYLLAALTEKAAPHFVMAQTSMGAMLVTPTRKDDDRKGYKAINSKRVDFAIVDEGGNVCLVVEFDGPLHAKAQNAKRDEIKTEALRKAGIKLFRVDYRLSDTEQEAAIRSVIGEVIA